MAIKLGTMLVQTGLLTLNQLDEALKYQAIFGGKLGTNLIEMGLAEEEDIAQLLSRKLHVPYTSSDQLLDIPIGTIKLLNPEVAGKYKVIPFHQEGKRLHLVLMDPSDLRAVDEIGFITGLSIRPMVAPEVSLVLALEKHYGIERDKRYISVIKKLLKNKGLSRKVSETGKVPAVESPSADSLQHWRDSITKYSVDELSSALADVKNRDEVADLILEYVGRSFEKAALFLARDQLFTGWQARIKGKNLEGFEDFSMAQTEPCILRTVLETRSFYLGTPPDTPGNNRIVQLMHDRLADTTLLIPICKQGRAVCVLYVSGDSTRLTGEFFELQKMTQKASLALDILILRNKILMT